MKKIIALLLAVFFIGLPCDSFAGIKTKAALITMNSSDVHWIRLKYGALARVEEFALRGDQVDLMCLAPKNYDIEEQIKMIREAIAAEVSYIIIACADPERLNGALKEALDAGIKIIYVDSPATIEGSATFATDNREAGAQIGEYLRKVLEQDGITKGMVGIITTNGYSDSCQERIEGFTSALKDTELMFTIHNYQDTNSARARKLAEGMIEIGVVAVYGADNYATIGAASAVKAAAMKGKKVYCAGWDNSEENLSAVQEGSLLACMLQDPWSMGKRAITAVVNMESGAKTMHGVIDHTGAFMVTQDNINTFKQ